MQNRLPTLFVSHGSPEFARNPGLTGPALLQWADKLPDVKAVLVMSPHWMTRGVPVVMTTPEPETWHDFGGFPAELYELQYPAKGEPKLAQKVIDILQKAGIQALADPKRPLDHGTWVPLMHTYPKANVPVLQISLPAGWSPAQLFELGKALRPLSEEGVLVVGSGSMTHNLQEVFGGASGSTAWVGEFSRWVEDKLQKRDLESLFNYRALAPHARRAHPTDEHFLTLYFALGAAVDTAKPEYLSREVTYETLAMDTFYLQ